jgi:hypothetical protein
VKRPASFRSRKRGDSNRFAGIALFSIVTAFIAIATACSNQGEGERCEIENGDEDCDTSAGLICWPETQLRNASSDRCCPADRSKATHPVCKTAVEIGVDAMTPADTGPAPVVEAGADVTTVSDAADASDAEGDGASDQ